MACHDTEGVQDHIIHVDDSDVERSFQCFHGDPNAECEKEGDPPRHGASDSRDQESDRNEQDGIGEKVDGCDEAIRFAAQLWNQGGERDPVGPVRDESARLLRGMTKGWEGVPGFGRGGRPGRSEWTEGSQAVLRFEHHDFNQQRAIKNERSDADPLLVHDDLEGVPIGSNLTTASGGWMESNRGIVC